MSVSVTIGLDVGGTKVAGGLVDAAGAVLERVVRPSVVGGARDPRSELTLAVARDLMARAGTLGLVVDGIGAGFPEYVDRNGRLTSHEVLAWSGQPADLLGALAPASVDSDVRCGALAEALLGAGRGSHEVAYTSVGSGLSYALTIDGRPRPGRRGEAIAFGELPAGAEFAGVEAVTLEQLAAGDAIRGAWAVRTGRPVTGGLDVVTAAAAGDPAAIELLERAGGAMGAGLAILARLLDPDVIVLGGGLGAGLAILARLLDPDVIVLGGGLGAGLAILARLLDPDVIVLGGGLGAGLGAVRGPWRSALDAAYTARAAPRPDPTPIIPAALGADAGIVGAVLMHRQAVARL